MKKFILFLLSINLLFAISCKDMMQESMFKKLYQGIGNDQKYPEISVVLDESGESPNNGIIKTTVETTPLPGDSGKRILKDIYFSILNIDPEIPLSLTGTPLVTSSNSYEFEIISQPSTSMISGGGKTTFGIRFSFDPAAPGDYSTIITIPNNDCDKKLYQFTLTVTGINTRAFFIDNPIYYNSCDYEEDFSQPLIGSQYAPTMIKGWGGDKMVWSFVPYRFQNGFFVGTGSKTGDEFCSAITYPFTVNKPDLSKGTCTYWASAKGGVSEKGDDTFLDSNIVFYLTSNTYVSLQAHGEESMCHVNCYVDGNNIYSINNILENKIYQFLIQWDFIDGFSDGTNVKFYLDENLCCSGISTVTSEIVNEYTQFFDQRTWVYNGGDYRPDEVPNSTIDNIIIWNKILDPDAVFGITSPK